MFTEDGSGEIWLDISRSLWTIFRSRLTGIDRVELAYARTLARQFPDRLRFVAYNYFDGGFRRLPTRRTADLIAGIAPAWDEGRMGAVRTCALLRLIEGMTIAPRLPRRYGGGSRPLYLNVSTHPLHLVDAVGRMLARTGAVFVPLIHDLIPISHPEYVPPAWTEYHHRRLQTIAQFADGVISNSATTAAQIRARFPALPVIAAHLGADLGAIGSPPTQGAPSEPYFLCVGTIEPRKNHLLLLQIWRRLVETMGPATPRLVLVGRRGWENEQVLDVLHRCEAIRQHVSELGMVSDNRLATLIGGARALLMPSFVEGYGLPVAEALAAGVPAICSDIPAHREIGRGVPDLLDPLDGPGWTRAIAEFAGADSALRRAQLARLAGWPIPTWQAHLDTVLSFAFSLVPRRADPQSRWSRSPWNSSIPRHQATNAASAASRVISQRRG